MITLFIIKIKGLCSSKMSVPLKIKAKNYFKLKVAEHAGQNHRLNSVLGVGEWGCYKAIIGLIDRIAYEW